MPSAHSVGAIAIPAARAVRRTTLAALAVATLLAATLTSFDAARLSATPAGDDPPTRVVSTQIDR